MGALTPWHAESVLAQPESAPPPPSKPALQLLLTGRLRQTWPYALTAVSSIAVFLMLFQTWLITPNWSGFNAVDAFGTTHTTTTHLTLWTQHPPPGTNVTGVWGIFATIAVFVTVFAAIQAIYRGTRIPGLVTAAAAVAVALFVVIDLFYIRSKQIPIQTMTGMGPDLASQLGLAVMALRGTGAYPWPGVPYVLNAAHLTPWAFTTAAFALGSAGVAVTRTWYSGLREVVAAVGRGLTQRQTRSINQWLSDDRSPARTAVPSAGSAFVVEPDEPDEDRDWGAAG
jgi:hypothetical protein